MTIPSRIQTIGFSARNYGRALYFGNPSAIHISGSYKKNIGLQDDPPFKCCWNLEEPPDLFWVEIIDDSSYQLFSRISASMNEYKSRW